MSITICIVIIIWLNNKINKIMVTEYLGYILLHINLINPMYNPMYSPYTSPVTSLHNKT